MTHGEFLPGLDLNRGYHDDVVAPLISDQFSGLLYSGALVGYGSDVMGYDNPTSMDHNWGPRMQIFLGEEDYERYYKGIDACFQHNLPFSYRGFPTNFTDPRYDDTQAMEPADSYPIRHLIEITTVARYLFSHLAVRDTEKLSLHKWLGFSDQKLLEITAGEVFHDGMSKLQSVRESLSFYPHDICLLRMAALWECVSQQEAFVGRCRELGDLLNAKLLAGRIVTLLLKICCYIERRYIPYSKWFGRAITDLPCYPRLAPVVAGVLSADNALDIEDGLAELYGIVVDLHNEQADLPHLDCVVRNYFNRPYKVIFAETIVKTLLSTINDSSLKSVDLVRYALDIKIDITDLTSCPVFPQNQE